MEVSRLGLLKRCERGLLELTQRLLLQKQKAGVEKFQIFGKVVQVVKYDKLIRPAAGATDSIIQTVGPNSGNELLKEENQQDPTDGGEIQIVNQEERIQLQRWSISHPFSATQNDKIVDEEHGSGLLQCRKRRLTWRELKVVSMVAKY